MNTDTDLLFDTDIELQFGTDPSPLNDDLDQRLRDLGLVDLCGTSLPPMLVKQAY